MATKADFTLEEWETLLSTPVAAGMLVVIADMHVAGLLREFEAMESAEADASTAGAAHDLVEALIADMKPYDDDKDTETSGEDARLEYLAVLRAAAGIVDGKCSPDEAVGYKQWIIATAQATAEASKEGGFLRRKRPTVSEQEAAEIREIRATLGF